MDDLKLCPECGSTAAATYTLPTAEQASPSWGVYCSACGFEIQHVSEEKAVAAWNTRAPSPEAEALARTVERLRDAPDCCCYGGREPGCVKCNFRDKVVLLAIAAFPKQDSPKTK